MLASGSGRSFFLGDLLVFADVVVAFGFACTFFRCLAGLTVVLLGSKPLSSGMSYNTGLEP